MLILLLTQSQVSQIQRRFRVLTIQNFQELSSDTDNYIFLIYNPQNRVFVLHFSYKSKESNLAHISIFLSFSKVRLKFVSKLSPNLFPKALYRASTVFTFRKTYSSVFQDTLCKHPVEIFSNFISHFHH